MMKYIDKMVADGITVQNDSWMLMNDSSPNCKFWVNWKGSDLNKQFPVIKSEHYFPDVDDPLDFVKAL